MMLSRRTTITALLGAATAGWANLRARAADPIRIGTILSVSGPAAFLGQDMKDGAQLAVDEINEAGGIGGRKIEWIFYDAQSQTQQAIAETRRLLSNDGVEMIVGGGNMSGIALAIAPMAEAAKIPFVSTEGASAIVNPVAERHWTFKSTVDDYLVLQRAADYFDKKGLQKIALLADTSGFGQGADRAAQDRRQGTQPRCDFRVVRAERYRSRSAAEPHPRCRRAGHSLLDGYARRRRVSQAGAAARARRKAHAHSQLRLCRPANTWSSPAAPPRSSCC